MWIPRQLVHVFPFLAFFDPVDSYECKPLAPGQDEALFAGQVDYLLTILEQSAQNRLFGPAGTRIDADGKERNTGAVTKFLGELRSLVTKAEREAGSAGAGAGAGAAARYTDTAATMATPLPLIRKKGPVGDVRDRERIELFHQSKELVTIMSRSGDNLGVAGNGARPETAKMLRMTKGLVSAIDAQIQVFKDKKGQRDRGEVRTYSVGERQKSLVGKEGLQKVRLVDRRAVEKRSQWAADSNAHSP